MKLFQSSSNIKESLTYLYQIAREKFQVEKQTVILEYTEEEYDAKFNQHKALQRLDDIELCVEDYNKEYF